MMNERFVAFNTATRSRICSWFYSPCQLVQAVAAPGHFEIRKSSSQVIRMHFFPQKNWRPFLVLTLKTQASNAVSTSK